MACQRLRTRRTPLWTWGAAAAGALRTFGGQIHGGLFDLDAGNEGPEYAGGWFRARFHYYKPNQLLPYIEKVGTC